MLPTSPLASNLCQHQGLFQWVGSSHQVAKVLELQLQHQSFYEYSALISFRIDWFDLLALQGTLKCLFQHYSSKASNLWKWQSTLVFLLGNSHGQRSLVSYIQSMGLQRVRHFSLLSGPTLTSVHNYWRSHCFDFIDLCWQSDVSAF